MCHLNHHSHMALQVNQPLRHHRMELPAKRRLRRTELQANLLRNHMAHPVSSHPANQHHHTELPVSHRHRMEHRVLRLHRRLTVHQPLQHPLLHMELQAHRSMLPPLRTELPVHPLHPTVHPPVSQHRRMAHHPHRRMALLVNCSHTVGPEYPRLLLGLHPHRTERRHHYQTRTEHLLLTQTHMPATRSPFQPTRLDHHRR